jgi:hypothetical protein
MKEQEILSAITAKMPVLTAIIENELGFAPGLKVEIERTRSGEPRFRISGTENLINHLGNTLVKTLFTKIKIGFWGGEISSDLKRVWFNPQIWYQHPTGGSNGTDFLFSNLNFMLDTQTWEYTTFINK